MFELNLWQSLFFFTLLGFAWVTFRVFTDQHAGHRDRDENDFGLFDDFF